MRNGIPALTALAAGLAASGYAAAQDSKVTPEQLLAYQPKLEALVDTPTGELVKQCKVEAVKAGGATGYVLRDHRGLVVRKLLATRGAKVDTVSYFRSGQEVYREVDTNGDTTPDTFRWYHGGGARVGVSSQQNGRIDEWKALSAEEAAGEAVAALAARDWNRMAAAMLTDADCKALGLDDKATGKVAEERKKARDAFEKLMSTIPAEAKFSRFDGHTPKAVAGTDAGSVNDLTIYHNGTIIADAAGKAVWLRAPELVRVGDVWKHAAAPLAMDEKDPQASAVAVLMPGLDQQFLAQDTGDSPVEANPEVQKLVEQLRKHDESMPQAADARALATYHVTRTGLCGQIAAKSAKATSREHWYRQAADSLDAAAQTKQYPDGVKTLEAYAEKFAATEWGKSLAPYYKYRAINAAYAIAMEDKALGPKAAEKYYADLEAFIKANPQAADAADALWQLGNGMEFANKDGEALGHYKQLAKDFPNSHFARKAAGAVRRIESEGQPARFAGPGLDGSAADTAQARGKITLVHFWSSDCEPCKQEIAQLAAALRKHGANGLTVVGVNVDKDANAAVQAARAAGAAWTHVQDKGGLDGEIASGWGIISLPTMLLLDEDGKVLKRNLQATAMDVELEKALTRRVATKGDAAK